MTLIKWRLNGGGQVFLFTDKDETPPVFNALAANMRKYKYLFADVHSSDRELMEKFGIEKVNACLLHVPARCVCSCLFPVTVFMS